MEFLHGPPHASSGAPSSSGFDFPPTAPRKISVISELDIGSQPTLPFEKRIMAITKEFQTIQEEQDDIALYLYGFSAPQKKIQKTHDECQKKLTHLSRRLNVATSSMLEALTILPFIDDAIVLSSSFHTFIVLLVKQHLLSRRSFFFLSCLKEPTYKLALELCKTKIKEAEEILVHNKTLNSTTLRLLAPKVQDLTQDITSHRKSIEGLDQKIKDSIGIVHKQAVRFFRYCLDKLQPSADTIAVDRQFKARLITLLDETFPQQQLADVTDSLAQLSLENPVSPSQKAPSLKSNRYFRHGAWFTKQRYPAIYPIVEKLQSTAQEIQDVQELQEKRMGALTLAPGETTAIELATDKITLNRLRLLVERDREALIALPFSLEIHAGLYYARELLSLLDESRFIHSLLSKLADSSNKFQSITATLRKLLAFLAQNPTGKTMSDLTMLFELAQEIERVSDIDSVKHRFVKDVCKTYIDAMTVTVARLGKKFLVHDATQHALLITTAHPIDEKTDKLPEELLLYVAKECLRGSDLEFDLRVYILNNNPKYQQLFKQALRQDRPFYEIYSDYTARNSLVYEDSSCFNTLSLIFLQIEHLTATEAAINLHNRSIQDIVWFTSAQSLLLEMKRPRLPSTRLQSLSALAMDKLKRAATLRQYPEYCLDFQSSSDQEPKMASDRALYHLLRQAVWADSGKVRTAATRTLKTQLQENPIEVHDDPVIQTLLDKFYLKKARNRTPLEPHEKDYLIALSMRYVSDTNEQIAYGQAYGIDFMEMVLYECVKEVDELYEQSENRITRTPLDKLIHIIFHARTRESFAAWKSVMKAYLAVKGPERMAMQANTDDQVLLHASYAEHGTYNDLFRYLLDKEREQTRIQQ